MAHTGRAGFHKGRRKIGSKKRRRRSSRYKNRRRK
jgi:hypothetical protein